MRFHDDSNLDDQMGRYVHRREKRPIFGNQDYLKKIPILALIASVEILPK